MISGIHTENPHRLLRFVCYGLVDTILLEAEESLVRSLTLSKLTSTLS